MITLSGVSKLFKKKNSVFVALKSLNLELPSASLIVLSGKSGAGKTTLLNILGGLDFPTEGEMLFNGEPITIKNADSYRAKNIGYVFQEYNLLNNVSISENLRVAFDLKGEKPTFEKMVSALSLVGLPDKGEDPKSFLKKRPVELSGGQRQRVAIARALIKNPNILLLDEPTGALDEDNSLSLLKLLKNLSIDRLVVFSTHNLAIAKPFADRLIKLEEGRLVADEPITQIQELESPKLNEKQGSLSFLSVLRSAFRGLKGSRLRLITSILISTLVSTGFGSLLSVQTAERNEVALRSQYDGNESKHYRLDLHKKVQDSNSFEGLSSFSQEQLTKIEEYCGDKKPVYLTSIDLSVNACSETWNGSINPFYNHLEINPGQAMVLDPQTGLYDASLTRDPRLKPETPCSLPEVDGEIAITDLQAQYFLELGLKNYEITCIDDLIGKDLYSDYSDPSAQKYKITGVFKTEDSLEFWKKAAEEYTYNPSIKETRMAYGFSSGKLWVCPKTKTVTEELESRGASSLMLPLSGSLQKDLSFIQSLPYTNEDGESFYVNIDNLYMSLADSLVVSGGFVGFLVYSAIFALLVLSLLLSLNLFYANIKGMERELGILRALGARKRDIRAIVFAQGILLGTLEFVLAIVGVSLVNSFLNSQIYISLLYANWIVVGSVFLALFLGMAAVSWLASLKAIRQKPVNVIDDK